MGGIGSSHAGGHYVNPATDNHYLHHQYGGYAAETDDATDGMPNEEDTQRFFDEQKRNLKRDNPDLFNTLYPNPSDSEELDSAAKLDITVEKLHQYRYWCQYDAGNADKAELKKESLELYRLLCAPS